MAQHDYNIANGSGLTVRSDINDALTAVRSQNSGSAAPTSTAGGMPWLDTANNAMKQRNINNSAWISQAEAIAGGPLAGHRNRIINGAMKIDQRSAGNSQSILAGLNLAYTVDRWFVYCSGNDVTAARVAVGAENRLRITGLASNTGFSVGQRIEAANSMDLAGRTCTLSCKLSSSSLTTITWTASYANSADTFGTVSSPTKTQIATGTFTISSTESAYSVQITVPGAATTGIEILFTGGALLGSQTFTLGDVQFEPGGVVTPFELRTLQAEMVNCYRTYWRVRGSASGSLPVGQAITRPSARATLLIPLPCEMRITPTAFVSNCLAIGITGTVHTVSGIDIVYRGQNQVAVIVTLNTSPSDHALHVYCNTTGFFELNAEL